MPLRHSIAALCLLSVAVLGAQAPDRAAADARARRVNERMRALQAEADRLAGESRTLIGDLRRLEIERDLKTEEANAAAAMASSAEQGVQQTTERIAALQAQRAAQLPDIKAQLVDIYKHGRAGNARLLFEATDLRDFARTTRAVAALTALNAKRVEEHRQTAASLQRELASLQQKTRELDARRDEAARARAAAEKAVSARTALMTQIDQRRDLAARYAGELQVAYDRLQQQLTSGRTDPVLVPIAAFRGALDWPAPGRITGRFGQSASRLGGSAVKNGVDIAAPEGTPVHAVHGGTVGFADSYPGFGTLVILDHGANNYSLYGYLGSASVSRGDLVESGAELGRVGTAPAGSPALYFELRIGGRSVDPLQWLKAR
jgi:septal ring factor EnvC (AmiA/AmiB activator)